MEILVKILIGCIALLHLYILVLEMFLWTTRGPKVFRSFPKDLFAPTKAMAANQGLYNGFLAAGLLWSLLVSDIFWSKNIALFFLGCIAIAGIYGAYSASKKILFIQTLPALIAIIAVLAI
ncbi:DUF1304 domain-containing protein [Flavobacterium sp. NRK F10]|uniref:DUF1304 domain-containing protein n=1 Tax=Flavobacterium sediminis TaxID=2201181 RepID=A0A2U8QXW4_9FLAO|nr:MULTISPECIES: DUF1304 domain-containing protein [Flavobacterium]AWM14948.1 DUF1304 domain-containing protein [Flavobacterium sediminis]MCO6176210.1 DUF1304 domain-containing protein [Flavobacterium sp. NRK F10]